MDIDSKLAQRLQAYLKSKSPEPNTQQFIELDGQRKPYSVYRIPLDHLVFNIRNGRFASELIAKEKAIGRHLDATKSADEVIIRQLLLDQSKDETETLTADLRRNGQTDPGIVTFDGAVINANRRMAIFSKLYADTKDPKHGHLLASVLPKNVNEKDLWRIEASLQFAKDFRLEYAPVNELLKIREGVQRGLSAKEISQSLLGRYSEKGVKERLEVLKQIETFLQLTGRKGEYHYIQQQRSMEKFNSLQSNVVEPLRRKQREAKEIAAVTNFAFALIDKTKRSHWDIRKLAKIAEQQDALRAIGKCGVSLDSALGSTSEKLDEAFGAASDVVDDIEEKDKPEKLIRRALSAIENIDPKSPKLHSPSVKELVQQLRQTIDRLFNESIKSHSGPSKRKRRD